MVVAEKGLSRGRGVLRGYARMFADVPGGSRLGGVLNLCCLGRFAGRVSLGQSGPWWPQSV